MAKHTSPVFVGFRGSVNRQLVFKQVNGQTIVTAFPDRTKVIFSERQRQKQRKFSDAVFRASIIIANPDLKKVYSLKASLFNFRSAWNVAIAEYMSGEPLKLKQEKVAFDKRIIQDQMGKEVTVKLYKLLPANYSNSGIKTGEAPPLQKTLPPRAEIRSEKPALNIFNLGPLCRNITHWPRRPSSPVLLCLQKSISQPPDK